MQSQIYQKFHEVSGRVFQALQIGERVRNQALSLWDEIELIQNHETILYKPDHQDFSSLINGTFQAIENQL